MSTFVLVLSIVNGYAGENVTMGLPEQTVATCAYHKDKCDQAKICPNFSFDVCSDPRFVSFREFYRLQPSGADFLYSTVWTDVTREGYSHWNLGELARVAQSPINGTVVLSRYYNGYNNRFSTKPLTPGWNPLTNAAYVPAYIFSEPREGTFGLYSFFRGYTSETLNVTLNVWRLALEYNIKAMDNMGWTNDDLLGYVYRPCPSAY